VLPKTDKPNNEPKSDLLSQMMQVRGKSFTHAAASARKVIPGSLFKNQAVFVGRLEIIWPSHISFAGNFGSPSWPQWN
jgi:hypothetical protein